MPEHLLLERSVSSRMQDIVERETQGRLTEASIDLENILTVICRDQMQELCFTVNHDENRVTNAIALRGRRRFR